MNCKIREAQNREETLRMFCRLQGREDKLPIFLYDDTRYKTISVVYEKDKMAQGLAFGVMQEGDSGCYLHYLRLSAAAAGKEDAICFSEELFRYLKREHRADKVIIMMDRTDDSLPPYVGIVSKIDGCRLENVQFLRQVGIYTKDFAHLRRNRWYCPDLMERMGFEAVPIKEHPGTWQELLKEKEKRGELPKDYLSPGLWEKAWEYDENSSYLLVKKGEEEPLGWIVTERLLDNIVKIRRFYIYNEARSLRLGPSFATWVLDRIGESYEQLRFEIEKGNRQMKIFVDGYCREILAFNYFKCNLTIKF